MISGSWSGRLLILVLLTVASTVAAEPSADEHLLVGARAFRTGDFSRALVEFRVAQKLGGDAEVHWYIGAALVKLERYEEAVESLGVLAELMPERRDPLFDYYRATACYGARLYVCAAGLLDAAIATGGPAVVQQARELKERLVPVLVEPPDKRSIDWYHQRAATAAAAERRVLMKANLSEAIVLGRRRTDAYRVAEAERKLSAGKAPPG